MSKETVEINGTKFEVDMDGAKRIDTFKVGDNVKILHTDYNNKIEDGVIVGFYNFKSLPTIQVAEFVIDYSSAQIDFININTETKDYEILPSTPIDNELGKTKVVEKMNLEIENKQQALDELLNKKNWFLKYYGKYFQTTEDEK